MAFKDLLSRSMKKDEDFAKAQKELKINKILEERQKSANERELDSRIEKEREERIKKELDRRRKIDTKELWTSNIFKNNKNIMKGKNIFANQKKKKDANLFFKSKEMKRK